MAIAITSIVMSGCGDGAAITNPDLSNNHAAATLVDVTGCPPELVRSVTPEQAVQDCSDAEKILGPEVIQHCVQFDYNVQQDVGVHTFEDGLEKLLAEKDEVTVGANCLTSAIYAMTESDSLANAGVVATPCGQVLFGATIGGELQKGADLLNKQGVNQFNAVACLKKFGAVPPPFPQ